MSTGGLPCRLNEPHLRSPRGPTNPEPESRFLGRTPNSRWRFRKREISDLRFLHGPFHWLIIGIFPIYEPYQNSAAPL